MSIWVPFTVETFRNALPVGVVEQHDLWAAMHPGKETRLVEIVAQVLAIFRRAVAASGRNVMDAAEDTVPVSGSYYAYVNAFYVLGMEMQLSVSGSALGTPVGYGGVVPTGEEPAPLSSSPPVYLLGTTVGFDYLAELGREMVRVGIWLRMVQSGAILIDAVEGEAARTGSPSYAAPAGREARPARELG
jgi:hypothetical protein